MSDSVGLRTRAADAGSVGDDVTESLGQGVIDVVVEIVDLTLEEDAVVFTLRVLGDAD